MKYVYEVSSGSRSEETILSFALSDSYASGEAVIASGSSWEIPTGSDAESHEVVVTLPSDTVRNASGRRLTLTATRSSGSSVSSPSLTTTLVEDDESPLFVRVSGKKRVSEGDGSVRLRAEFVDSEGAQVGTTNHEHVAVEWRVVDGTAVHGSDGDYRGSRKGSVTISAGDTDARLSEITIRDDSLDEDDETFDVVVLSASSGVLIYGDDGAATVTITDDDLSPTVSFSSSSYEVAEGDTASLGIELSSSTYSATRVSWSVSGSGASVGWWFFGDSVGFDVGSDRDFRHGRRRVFAGRS